MFRPIKVLARYKTEQVIEIWRSTKTNHEIPDLTGVCSGPDWEIWTDRPLALLDAQGHHLPKRNEPTPERPAKDLSLTDEELRALPQATVPFFYV